MKAIFPLPNDVHPAGFMCIRSFADQPENHTVPHRVIGWLICVECGEVVRPVKGQMPEHSIPNPATQRENWADRLARQPVPVDGEVRDEERAT